MWPINKIKKILEQRKEVITEIDPDLMKRDEAYAHMAKAYVYEKGKRTKAEKVIENLTKPTDTSEISKYLNEQKKELVQRDIGVDASVKEFLKYAKLKKKSIRITSHNGAKDFGILKDLGLARNGLIGIYVYGINRPIISGKTPQDIFKDCAGLRNDARVGQIRINLNEKGEYVENLDQKETPNVIIDFNKKITVTNYDMKPFIERIIEKNNIIDDQMSELKNKEMLLSELNMELNGEKKENEVLKSENSSYKVSLSDSLNSFKEVQKNYHNLTKNLNLLEEDNNQLEESLRKKEEIIEEIHQKLSEFRKFTSAEKVQQEMQKLIQWYEGLMSDRTAVSDMFPEPQQKPMPKAVKV